MSTYREIQNLKRDNTISRVVVREVNTTQAYVKVEDAYGSEIQISMDFHDPLLAIPQIGEIWLATRSGNEWSLGKRLETGVETQALADLAPGDRRLEAPNDLILVGQDIQMIGNVFVSGVEVATQSDILDVLGEVEADPRWTDQRVPLDNSVTNAKIVAGAGISISKLASYPADSTKYLAGDGSWPSLPPSTAGASGLLSAIPTASSTPNKFYYATDQDVLYFSNGTIWLRQGLPAGATTMIFTNTVPTGWVAYDGSNLPASTGIYAALATHLGGVATPDSRGRMLVAKGTHTDVSTLGNSDGQAVANRRPKHQTSNALSGTYSGVTGTENQAHNHSWPSGFAGANPSQSATYRGTDDNGTGNITSGTENQNHNHSYSGSVSFSGSIGTNVANDNLDAPSYIVFTHIAKL